MQGEGNEEHDLDPLSNVGRKGIFPGGWVAIG
jgi:hypothetical protein